MPPTTSLAVGEGCWRWAHRTVHSDCPVAHQTSGAPIASSLHQRLWKWLGAINTPQPPHSLPSKPSEIFIHCKSKSRTLQDTIKAINPLKVPKINSSALGLVRGSLVFFVALVAWLGLFFFPSISQVTCNRSKRHLSVWWSLRGLSDP